MKASTPSVLKQIFLTTVLGGCAVGCLDEAPRESAPAFNSSERDLPAHVQPQGGATSVAEPDELPPYPDGPYAGLNPQVGEIVENLNFIGFLSTENGKVVSTHKYQNISLKEIRQSGSEFLLIHIAAIWCATCHVAAAHTNNYVSEIRHRGGDVLELVVDGQSTGADPRREDLELWVELEDLTMTTVGPDDERVRRVFRDKEYAYIIRLKTMEVVWRSEGLAVFPTPAEQGAQELLNNWLEIKAD